jgi:hypothetical protein
LHPIKHVAQVFAESDSIGFGNHDNPSVLAILIIIIDMVGGFTTARSE